MKKSQLVKLIKEELQGYSKYIGKTKGGTSDEFTRILTAIANKVNPEEYKGDAERGHAILDKANPDNVARITRGEKPIYEGEGGTMDLQQLVDYIKGLSPEVQLYIPTIYPGGFGKDQQTKRTVDQAVQALTDVLDSSDHNETQFKLTEDDPTFKKFSVVQSPEELARRSDMVRSMGSLD
jgi:hypothetical protein